MSRERALRAARSLALDAALAEVAVALREAGIRALLIKGPAVARWLYEHPSEREYGDIDLLVHPDRYHAAGATLARLGFAGPRADVLDPAANESAWRREGERFACVDLHRRILLIDAPPALAWARLSEGAQRLTVAGAPIETPSPAAHLLILALHAAQHGAREPKPLSDLRRAIARVEDTTWRAAGALATELGAGGAMREGLQLVAGGRELADRLALADDASRLIRLSARSAPTTAGGLERLIATPGARARLALLARKLVPSRALMRRWQPLARRGWLGLALAYLWRPLWLLAKLPRATAAWSAVALPRERRAKIPAVLAGGWWALRAWRRCRAQLREGGLHAVALPAPPPERPGVEGGIERVLHRLSASCLERSLVRQRWLAAHGHPREVVIGVHGPTEDFGAHAWLAGDTQASGGFTELGRWPPPG